MAAAGSSDSSSYVRTDIGNVHYENLDPGGVSTNISVLPMGCRLILGNRYISSELVEICIKECGCPFTCPIGAIISTAIQLK